MESFYFSKDDEVLLDEDYKVVENYKELPYMLFYSLTSVFPMAKYEEELKEINDYIYHNQINLNRILGDMKSKKEEAKNSDRHAEYYGEILMFSEAEEATWEWLIETVNKCNNIVLFLSFIEGALKEICNWFSERTKYTTKNKAREISNIEYYVMEIGNCCNYDIYSKLKTELEIIRIAKKVRNIFVHEWDAYYNEKNRVFFDNTLETLKITELIDAISKILYFCEIAGIEGKVLEKENNDIGKAFTMMRIDRIKKEFSNCQIIDIIDTYFNEN